MNSKTLEEAYVTPQLAFELKLIGFPQIENYPKVCVSWYEGNLTMEDTDSLAFDDEQSKIQCICPTLSLVHKWLINNFNTYVMVCPKELIGCSNHGLWKYRIYRGLENNSDEFCTELYASPDDALENGIREALRITKINTAVAETIKL